MHTDILGYTLKNRLFQRIQMKNVPNTKIKKLSHTLKKITPFQKKVYQIVKTIPYGEVRSYQWVAEKIDKPRAARAVGQALKKNPWPIIIPCHRVIRKDGSLGGFSAGAAKKFSLLNAEARTPKRFNPLFLQKNKFFS